MIKLNFNVFHIDIVFIQKDLMKVIIYALLLLLGAVGFGLWNSAPSAGPAQLEGY